MIKGPALWKPHYRRHIKGSVSNDQRKDCAPLEGGGRRGERGRKTHSEAKQRLDTKTFVLIPLAEPRRERSKAIGERSAGNGLHTRAEPTCNSRPAMKSAPTGARHKFTLC